MIQTVERNSQPESITGHSCSHDCGPTIELRRPEQLTSEQEARWISLLQTGVQENSPFLHPEFARAVAAVRDDVEVGIMNQDGAAVGFFPFQRGAWNVGKPVGGRLSSYQGLVVDRDAVWTAEQIVGGCGLAAWRFDQLDARLAPFARHSREVEGAAFLDLSNGFDEYRDERRLTGSSRIPKVESLHRKLCREAALVRFDFHLADWKPVETLIEWKSTQFRETGLADVFANEWTINLLRNMLARPTADFSVVVSALRSWDRPIAVSYALRTNDVLHGMFIAYDREYSKYSPGMILLLETAREAATRGIRRFMLGSGGDHYKRSLASGESLVAIGSVECGLFAKAARQSWEMARHVVHSRVMQPWISLPLKWIRPMRERLSFR